MQPFPRRVRAVFGGQTVVDTDRAVLLYETGLPPQVYVPQDDLTAGLIAPTEHHTYCPFKGTASYWTVTAGGKSAENAIWAYPEPNAESAWLQGYAGFYFSAMDEWYDEDEVVAHGGLQDPYHRVDVRRTSRPVRVLLGDQVLAQTTRPLLLSETGLPNRFYIPAAGCPAGPARAQRHAHRVPVQGHRVLLVDPGRHRNGGQHRDADRRRLGLPRGPRRFGRRQRLPVLPARRPDRRGRLAHLVTQPA